MQILVNQLLTQYQISGKGKLVVLLHGWGDNSKGLAELQKNLAKEYQVITLDLPGFGSTQAPKDVWDLDNYAEFIQSLLKKLELEPPYALIGHSNGGAVAVRAIALGILKPTKLVLLAASGIRNKGGGKRTALKIVAKTGNVATLWLPQASRRSLRARLYVVAGSDMLIVPGLEETFKKTVRQDVQKDATTITIPTLLVYGENDQATPVSYGQTYAALIKGSRLEFIADAGHFVHQDQPVQTTKLITEFLK